MYERVQSRLADNWCVFGARRIFALFLCLGLCAVTTMAYSDTNKIYRFKVNAEDLAKYHDFLQGRDPLSIQDTKSDFLWRHPLELFLFQIAPVVGGCDCRVEYEERDLLTTHVRAIVNVRKGVQLSHPIAGFDDDPRLAEEVYHSEPILAADEFFVGLYTHKDRKDILALEALEDIRKLRFVTAPTWHIDNLVIKNMGLPHVIADHWNSLLLMLQAGRADVVMQPFSPKEDFSFDYGDPSQTYLPIRNVQILFNYGRRFFVSKKHPDGAEFLQYLNRGILNMRESGFLAEANINAGLVNPRTKDWTLLQ